MSAHDLSTILRLANHMKARLTTGQPPYNFFLGAGASVPSTYPTAAAFVDAFLEHSAVETAEMSEQDKKAEFDSKWKLAGEANTKAFLKLTLPNTIPSIGYKMLASLARANYVSNIITTNVDTLIQQALTSGQADPQGFRLLSHPLYTPRQISDELNVAVPRLKVLKLHGDLLTGMFLFTADAVDEFPPELATSLTSILQRDTIFCGYGFKDEDVQKCLIKPSGAAGPSIFVVSPDAPDGETATLLDDYAVGVQTVTGDSGDFDEFMKQLAAALDLYTPGAWATFETKFEQSSLEGLTFFGGPVWIDGQTLVIGGQDAHCVMQSGNLYLGEEEAQIDIKGEFIESREPNDWIGVASTQQIWSHLVYLRSSGRAEIQGPPFGTVPSVADADADISDGFHLRVLVGRESLRASVLDSSENVLSTIERACPEEHRWRGGVYLHAYFAKAKVFSIRVRPYPAP